jgi:hypothetical protein
VASMRRGGEPGAGILLPPVKALGRAAHRGRLGIPALVAQLGFERDSWVAPVDAKRVKPTENTDEAAAEQVRALVQQLPEPEALPIFVFDAGYDPVKLPRALEGCPAQILVRLHSKRVFYAAPEEVEPRPVGRGRWAARGATARSSTSRIPQAGRSLLASTAAKATTTARYASDAGRVCTPQDSAYRRALRVRKGTCRARHCGPLVEVSRLPKQTRKPKEALAVVQRAGPYEPRSALAGVLPQVRSRTHDPLLEANLGLGTTPRFRHPEQADPGGRGWCS